jgi:cysteine desulfurase
VEAARAQVAALIGADAREIVWTSGATESKRVEVRRGEVRGRKSGRGREESEGCRCDE